MINTLTSFRFFAALAVFLFHSGGIYGPYGLGSAGVQFFFILSGFILTYTYYGKFDRLNKSDVKHFYKARFAKIYPMHFLTFLLAIPWVLMNLNPDGLYIFIAGMDLLLLQSYVPISDVYFSFNNVSWTLSAEVFFYAIFPFILYLFGNKIIKNMKKTSAILIFSWILLFSLQLLLPQEKENTLFVWLLNIFPAMRSFEFIIGIVLGLLFLKLSKKNSIFTFKVANILEIGCLAVLAVLLFISKSLPLPNLKGLYFTPIWTLIIFVFAYNKGVISKIISHKYFVYLGQISFSFYMIHLLVLLYMRNVTTGPVPSYIVSLIITLVLSSLAFKFYEEPMRKLIKYRKKKEVAQNKPFAVDVS
ncbi:acyltransferase family protein [Paenibacillus wynnii]|uniref:acyltransferase family protein n=1 Tax=Paenibacillus wynnii TaxID=268407 RepID=UPI0027926CC7|nr:acyltransferase [Paenibacillus wynnii]MDQ0194432.1 peptidoglycan/LPS O-acetylase OafA/YrhL [Paenibacillus wynnii]